MVVVDLCSVVASSGHNKGLDTHGASIDHRSFQAPFLDLTLANVKQLNHHIEWMPERTGVRICLTYESCQLNIRKMKSKPELRDDNVWDEAGPDELDIEGDVTQWRCSSSLTWIRGAAMLTKLSQLSTLLGPLKWSSTAKAHVFRSYPCQFLRRKREVVNKYCFVVWVWCARHKTTVFDMAAGELIEGRVELRARIIVHSSEMFQLAKPFARSQVVVGVDASMEKQKFGSRSSARLPPEASRIQRTFHVFNEDSRPLLIGTSC